MTSQPVENMLSATRRIALPLLWLEGAATLAALVVFEFAASAETQRLFDFAGPKWSAVLRLAGLLYAAAFGALG